MIKPLQAVKSVPYTVVISALVGFILAPFIVQFQADWKYKRDHEYDESNPVVRMSAEVVERTRNEIVVNLTGEKLRPCGYLGMYAYGLDVDGSLHAVYREKIDIPEVRETRPTGVQDFGTWRIWPLQWVAISLYTRHDCDGRIVLTKVVNIPLDNK